MKRWTILVVLLVALAVTVHAAVNSHGGVKVTAASRLITFSRNAEREITATSLGGLEFSLLFSSGTNDTLFVPPNTSWTGVTRNRSFTVLNPNGDTIYVAWVER